MLVLVGSKPKPGGRVYHNIPLTDKVSVFAVPNDAEEPAPRPRTTARKRRNPAPDASTPAPPASCVTAAIEHATLLEKALVPGNL